MLILQMLCNINQTQYNSSTSLYPSLHTQNGHSEHSHAIVTEASHI